MRRRSLFYVGLFLSIGFLLAACGAEGPVGPAGPQGEQGPPGPAPEASELSCTNCHDDSTQLTGIQTALSSSNHGNGETYVRAGNASCAGCHSGGAFSEMIAAGLNASEIEAGDPNPTRQDCRTCHQIHTTYIEDDFALETTDPVVLYVSGETFEGGLGNLCVNCHQPRTAFPEAVDGQVEITTTHWGPHHGPQSAMLLGIAGAGAVEGSPSKHATQVENSCVGCHMGEGRDHTFATSVTACVDCHEGVENFDVNGVQTQVQALLDELEAALVARGLLDEEGHPAVQIVPEAEAGALWNWIYIAHEDKSLGVHNPTYTIALLEWSLESLK